MHNPIGDSHLTTHHDRIPSTRERPPIRTRTRITITPPPVRAEDPNPHLAFGVGPHRCIGMHLARTMFAVLMGEILTRIPDYQVDHEATRFYQGNPELAGVVTMPATFTPGPAVGVERPF